MTERGAISGCAVVFPAAGRPPRTSELAADALQAACQDAGIEVADVDGVILNRNELIAADHLTLDLDRRLGLGPLSVAVEVEAKGTTFSLAIDHARSLVEAGRARAIAVLFADAAAQPGAKLGAAFAAMGGGRGPRGLERAQGMLGAVAAYAFLANHYFAATGATPDDLADVAIAQRANAVRSPLAWNRAPLTMDEYRASPVVAGPLRRLDCARPVSGAACVIVACRTLATRAARPAVTIGGAAQRAQPRRRHTGGRWWEPVGARAALDDALAQAGIAASDIDVLQIYDPFTVVPLILLEAFGFAQAGQAGSLVRDGATAVEGALPTNTGGGQISGYYMQGVTPVLEAIDQIRGTAGDRQVRNVRNAVVAAIGGRMEHHSSLVLQVAA